MVSVVGVAGTACGEAADDGDGAGGSGADGGSSSGGSGASNGNGSGGNGTGGAVDALSQCSPGELVPLFVGSGFGLGTNGCDSELYEGMGFENPGALSIVSVELAQPMTADQPYAFSFAEEAGSGTVEVWGSTSQCGEALEALWWVERATTTHCAEVVPSQNFTHIHFVRREEAGSLGFSVMGDFYACSEGAGACEKGTDGHARGASGGLEPPIGVFEGSGSNGAQEWDLSFGNQGKANLYKGASSERQLAGGVFRMPPNSPYADGWYCVGSGSTVVETENEDSGDTRLDVSLQNITRLPDCATNGGTGTAELNINGSSTTVTSSLALLEGIDFSQNSCNGARCDFDMSGSDLEGNVMFSRLVVDTDGDMGDYFTPTGATVNVEQATWIVRPTEGGPAAVVCATGGTVLFGQEGSQVSLSELSELHGCPGEAVEDATYEFSVLY